MDIVRLVLPAILPSWRFFDRIAPSPRIEVTDGVKPLKWNDFQPQPEKVSPLDMLRRLIFNPERNESLYVVSLAERVLEDGRDHAEREIARMIRQVDDKSVCYRIVTLRREADEVVREEAVRIRLPSAGLSGGA